MMFCSCSPSRSYSSSAFAVNMFAKLYPVKLGGTFAQATIQKSKVPHMINGNEVNDLDNLEDELFDSLLFHLHCLLFNVLRVLLCCFSFLLCLLALCLEFPNLLLSFCLEFLCFFLCLLAFCLGFRKLLLSGGHETMVHISVRIFGIFVMRFSPLLLASVLLVSMCMMLPMLSILLMFNFCKVCMEPSLIFRHAGGNDA